MKNTIMKFAIFVFVTFFFQAILLHASEAEELTPFYKSWLKERSYTHPSLSPKSQSSSTKKMSHSKATASVNTATSTMGNKPFYQSWLKERSYAHPGITSSAATSVPVKNISEVAPDGKAKSSAPEYKSRPEFNVCNFVCLSTCKSCKKSSSSNYLMSRE